MSLAPEAIRALVTGEHGDPFSVLGPHPGTAGTVEVRAFLPGARDPRDLVVCVCNFTAVPRHGYRVGVPRPGFYAEVVNTDSEIYGGGNLGNLGATASEAVPWHGREESVVLTLPPLAVLWLRPAEG